jgi:hypothetical protein
MNVWAVSYEFNGQERTILIESAATHKDAVAVHPSIMAKSPLIEFVGTLA